MKADEVLRLYTAGNRNFHRVNLRGQSFNGKNLSGADFTEADIRGANFNKANLKSTNFSSAKAGLERYSRICLVIGSLFLSVISGLCLSLTCSFVAYVLSSNVIKDSGIFPGVVILLLYIVFSIVAFRQGFATAVWVGALAVTGGWALAGTIAKPGALTTAGAGAGAAAFAGAGAGTFAGAVSVAIARFLGGTKAGVGAVICFFVGSIAGSWTKAGAETGSLIGVMTLNVCGALVVGLIGWQAYTGNELHVFIRVIAIAYAAMGGTSFQDADLTDADFAFAKLKSTNFRGAILTRTNWYEAKKLDLARVGNSILAKPSVRDLLVSRNGYKKSYQGVNLKAANLTRVNLKEADLTQADLTQATLQEANLDGANLTRVQAVGTDFRNAELTGASLEAWNIDSTTKLQQVNCRYVYLQQDQRERRPSSGEFAPGEFTKLFQEVLDTVDLILRNGIDWEAFTYSFKNLQVENEDIELSIRSIENMGDGVIVVKVNVPADVNKAKIHSDFTQSYEFALIALEARYQAELKSKDQQIAISRQHQADLQEVVKMLASRPVNLMEGKLVVLRVGEGDFKQGFPVTLQIGSEGDLPFAEITGELSPDPEILEDYSRWQSAYRRSLLTCLRIKVPATQVTNFSTSEFIKECNESAESLRKSLNVWLNSESFRPIKERLLEKLNTSESIRVILQTENQQVRRLPWNLWDFFERYPKAEFALSSPVYERVEKSSSPSAKVRVLAILGHDTEIDLQKDRKILEQLPDAEVNFIEKPQRKELNYELWSQPWDILFFAGHSSSLTEDNDGQIYINETDSLKIDELKYALRVAIAQNLKLAIFNSCDGLGLASKLADLQIPQIIVMREPVPDQVAQEFLKNFLEAFAAGKSLYLSVREAREKLQGLENEFPCATWLPVICQNPAEVPKTWQEFRGV